ncbi:MAG: 4Fe-4S dicluster domain-containing protein [Anaerolineae bacterium]
MANRLAMYIDTSKCMACRGCQVACKQWNDLPAYVTENTGSYENPKSLDHYTWTRIKFEEYDDPERFQWLFLKEGCMHCAEAACVDVCPTGALKYGDHGIITFERELCNGCGYCSQFCPFEVPHLNVASPLAGSHDLHGLAGEEESTTALAGLSGEAKSAKCTFCQDRTMNGLKPACVKTCPAGALDWGDRDEMIAKAERRVEELKAERGFPKANIYGKTQLGGLGRIYVLKAPPEAYGLPVDPQYPVMSTVWQKFLQPVGQIAFGATVVGALAAFFAARRHVQMEEVE